MYLCDIFFEKHLVYPQDQNLALLGSEAKQL